MRSRFTGLAGWLRNTFIDYPGTLASAFFFAGCNLRCPYCHNGHVVNAPCDISDQSDVIWDFLTQQAGLLTGTVITGGEPTLHAHLPAIVSDMRSLGYRIKLDTNGMLPDVIESLAPDYLALDVKTHPAWYVARLWAPYPDAADRLLRSVAMVRERGEAAEVRITVAPTLLTPEVITTLASVLAGVSRVFLQPMDTSAAVLDPSIAACEPVTQGQMEVYCRILGESVKSCRIR